MEELAKKIVSETDDNIAAIGIAYARGFRDGKEMVEVEEEKEKEEE